jgi:hypothetical protein
MEARMPGRHTTTKRPSRAGPVLAAIVAVAVIVALGVYLAPRLTAESDASGCGESKEIAIATPPDLASAMMSATETMAEDGGSSACFELSVNTVFPDSSVSQINANTNSTPTVWILDTKARLSDLEPGARQHAKVVGNAANTPIVIGIGQRASHRPPATWKDAFESSEFVLPSPSTSVASAMAIAALAAEGDDIDAVLADVAHRQAASGLPVPDTSTLLRSTHRMFGPAYWFPVTEQQYVGIRMRRASWQLTALLPESGTTVLDYPIVVRSDADTDTAKVADELATFLSTIDGTSLLGERGFRAPNGEIVNGGALGPVSKVLQPTTSVPELVSAWDRAEG